MLVTIVERNKHPVTGKWEYVVEDSEGIPVNTNGGSGGEWLPETRLSRSQN
jgi:hypothetical protein